MPGERTDARVITDEDSSWHRAHCFLHLTSINNKRPVPLRWKQLLTAAMKREQVNWHPRQVTKAKPSLASELDFKAKGKGWRNDLSTMTLISMQKSPNTKKKENGAACRNSAVYKKLFLQHRWCFALCNHFTRCISFTSVLL